jgi:twitching motility protein PilT
MKQIEKILEVAINLNASDIHITNKVNPVVRIDGELQILNDFEINNPELIRKYIEELLDQTELKQFDENKCLDSAFQYEDTRFRLHAYKQMKCDALVLRLIPTIIPTFSQMNLPLILKKFTTMKSGLVLVVGITGSGKSTTLATMIDEINKNYSKHIITVENPVEFIHNHNKSIINQREIGTDVNTFADAVKDAMREDPDILLVGELRDLDTISNAITMAETGHLVFGTLHTSSVTETVDRIIDVFPPAQQEQIRIQLSNSIQGVVSQELLPKIGGGRVPCCEIMFVNDAIKNLIREHANSNSFLDQIMINSKKTGSQTKTQALAKLVSNNLITKETAMSKLNETEIDSLNKMIMAASKR